MAYWKFMRSKIKFLLKLFARVTLCFVGAFLTYTVAVRAVSEYILWNVPVRIVTFIVHILSPSTIINGELAYDVYMGDSFVFYGLLIFISYFFLLYRFHK